MTQLKIGTRGSALALAQAEQMASALRAAGADVVLVPVASAGDRSTAPIPEIGVGVFVSALRDALAAGQVDVAVHSYKDLPTADDPRLALPAIPLRADPRDALVARDGLVLGALPPGARVGTGAPRRVAQLNALGLGLEIVPVRGNVDTRIGKVRAGQLDAVVVARAGLERLGRLDEASEVLDPLQLLPAPAQGALAVECRAGDPEIERLLRDTLDHAWSRTAVRTERALLAALEAGCDIPVGALAEVVSDLDEHGSPLDVISLRAVLGTPTGELLRASGTADVNEPEQLGKAVAAELLDLDTTGAPDLSGPAGDYPERNPDREHAR